MQHLSGDGKGSRPLLLEPDVWIGKVSYRSLGGDEEEAIGNPSGLAATIHRAASRSRKYVSNRDLETKQTVAIRRGPNTCTHDNTSLAVGRLTRQHRIDFKFLTHFAAVHFHVSRCTQRSAPPLSQRTFLSQSTARTTRPQVHASGQSRRRRHPPG